MHQNFLSGLDEDLKQSLWQQLRTMWTHASNAIEGNSLTLGETFQVLTEGLTIHGKPLADHNAVIGHANAIDLVRNLLRQNAPITTREIFDLHKAIQSQVIVDIYNPIGAWKREPNSTAVILNGKSVINDTYAFPEDVPELMKVWIKQLNTFISEPDINPVKNYTWLHAAFVRIHPFADGNGRLARLLSNLPLLTSGLPPLVIENKKRAQYIRTLAKWQTSIGRPKPGSPLIVENKDYIAFEKFCEGCWKSTQDLVDKAKALQKKRDEEKE